MSKSLNRREFLIGTTSVLPITLVSCTQVNPLDFERSRICSSRSDEDAYKGTCKIMQQQIINRLAFTLLNYVAFFKGALFGEPILKLRGSTDYGSLGGIKAKNVAVKDYVLSIEPSLQKNDFSSISSHTERDVKLSSIANNDTKFFINNRSKIEISGTSAEKYRYETGTKILERTCVQNRDSLIISHEGYSEILLKEPKLNNPKSQKNLINIDTNVKQTEALIQLLRRG